VSDEKAPAARPFVEPLPVVGTTWYERGPAYWIRRALASVVLLAVLALYGGVVALVRSGIGSAGASVVFLTITAVCTVASAGWYLRRQRLERTSRREAREKGRREVRRYRTVVVCIQAAALLLAAAAIAGGLLGNRVGGGLQRTALGILALLVVLFFVGTVLATGGALLVVLVQSLAPELPREREARTRLGAGRRGRAPSRRA
jgi:hypothetical protein